MSYHEGSNWQARKEDEGKPLYENKKWRRYRFKTKSVDDYRPIIFNASYPWWCSGYETEDFEIIAATIVAYLPIGEDLKKYWDDADNIEFTDCEKISFSDRFPKPDWYKEA